MAYSADPMAQKLRGAVKKSETLWVRLREISGQEVKARGEDDGLNEGTSSAAAQQIDLNLDESLKLTNELASTRAKEQQKAAEVEARLTSRTTELEAKLQKIEDEKKAAAERAARDPNRWRPSRLWAGAAALATTPFLAAAASGGLAVGLWWVMGIQYVVAGFWALFSSLDGANCFKEQSRHIASWSMSLALVGFLVGGIFGICEKVDRRTSTNNLATALMDSVPVEDNRLFAKNTGYSLCAKKLVGHDDKNRPVYEEDKTRCFMIAIKDVQNPTNGESAIKTETAAAELIFRRDSLMTGKTEVTRGNIHYTRVTSPDGKMFRVLND
jgi:hypothetical protein